MKKRSANFQFEISYTYARDLSNVEGAPISSCRRFANELGSTLSGSLPSWSRLRQYSVCPPESSSRDVSL